MVSGQADAGCLGRSLLRPEKRASQGKQDKSTRMLERRKYQAAEMTEYLRFRT
jgi:hypothetical protein